MCLNNTVWLLREFRESDGVMPVMSDTTLTAVFKDTSISGSGGCNIYGGKVRHCQGNAGSIAISEMITTLILCHSPAGVMEQESKFLTYLQAVSRFECGGGSLLLSEHGTASGRTLVFDPQPVTQVGRIDADKASSGGTPVSCEGVETFGWYAWNNKMPPKPDDFHVVGEVIVSNPGVEVALVPKVPQGINPRILLMELHLRQLPGQWPQVVTTKQVRYDKILVSSDYESVTVFCGESIIANIPVDTIH